MRQAPVKSISKPFRDRSAQKPKLIIIIISIIISIIIIVIIIRIIIIAIIITPSSSGCGKARRWGG